MAHGQRAAMLARRSKEFWSRRCIRANHGTGRYYKRMTHRFERRQAKRIVLEALSCA